jgi:GNAT superfamily N-acetyltransferase
MKKPEDNFVPQKKQSLEWITGYGVIAQMYGLPGSHGYSKMPDLKCSFTKRKYTINIGWVEGISMYGGGTVRIKHFALEASLTRRGLGKTYLEALIRFFKKHNAIVIEFHENHSSKNEHYRQFFGEIGVKEIRNGIWQVDLYENTEIPSSVEVFQQELAEKNT